MNTAMPHICAAVSVLCLCCHARAAEPQENATPESRNDDVIQTVEVTAERRAQPLQKMPLSIQAFSSDTLDKAGVGSNMDLQAQVPGLVMTENAGYGQIYIRGIGSDIIGHGVEGAVAVYVDGVYQSRPSSALSSFLDVARVEVLQGPQGTLYGRNATGGAINIISKAPGRTLEGQLDAQLGSFRQKIVRGTVSGPLADGIAYGRVSVVSNRDDGHIPPCIHGPITVMCRHCAPQWN